MGVAGGLPFVPLIALGPLARTLTKGAAKSASGQAIPTTSRSARNGVCRPSFDRGRLSCRAHCVVAHPARKSQCTGECEKPIGDAFYLARLVASARPDRQSRRLFSVPGNRVLPPAGVALGGQSERSAFWARWSPLNKPPRPISKEVLHAFHGIRRPHYAFKRKAKSPRRGSWHTNK
jgi:hypothetical protein